MHNQGTFFIASFLITILKNTKPEFEQLFMSRLMGNLDFFYIPSSHTSHIVFLTFRDFWMRFLHLKRFFLLPFPGFDFFNFSVFTLNPSDFFCIFFNYIA